MVQASVRQMDGDYKYRHKDTWGTLLRGIPFQEYSEHFPHHKYALGIAGRYVCCLLLHRLQVYRFLTLFSSRPGGPDFYVNMRENLRIHGPGGQGHNYEGDAEADSCFARLIEGGEIIDKIRNLPYHKEGGLHILDERVEIVKAIVRKMD